MTKDEKNYLKEVYVDIDFSKIKEIYYIGIDDNKTGLFVFKDMTDTFNFSNFHSSLARINHFNFSALTEEEADAKIQKIEEFRPQEVETYELNEPDEIGELPEIEVMNSEAFSKALAKKKDPTLVFPEPEKEEDHKKDGVIDINTFKEALSTANKKMKPK